MNCFAPLSLPRPNGRGPADRVSVPCGKCEPCLNRKRNHWSFRCSEEFKNSESSYFITLTYDEHNEALTLGNVSKSDIQEFISTLRYHSGKLRYFISSEYGPETCRPHYHGLLFYQTYKSFDRINQDVLKSWKKGNIKVDFVNDARVAYSTGYIIQKSITPPGLQPVFSLMSRRPGIGASYLAKHKAGQNGTRFYATLPGGIKQPLPRYYIEKLFNEYQREVNNSENAQNLAQRDLEINRYCAAHGIPYLEYIEALKRAYLASHQNKLKQNKKL